MKELLKTVIYDQQGSFWKPEFIRREVSAGVLEGERVAVISGIRRCGKSTLLHQIRDSRPEKAYYFNFDDERLVGFSVEHFQALQETFIELFGVQKTWYFDEIQNVPGWERFVRRLHDMGHKVFITGSNATMLSRELGTHLTGRYSQVELFPFSFKEFLQYRGASFSERDMYHTESRGLLLQQFNAYAVEGGFPVYLREKQDDYLKSLYQGILYRDVMVRHKLTNEKELLELVHFLASNAARLTSYTALTKVSGIKHPATIKNYLSFLEEAYLLFQVGKYDYSLKKQIQNPKKVYFIDNALVRKVGFLFSEESGRLLENMVFLQLRRQGREVFYHHGQRECDFVIREGAHITEAIQVCERIEQPGTLEREMAGLADAMQAYNLPSGTLLLRDGPERTINIPDGRNIRQIPVWKWLLAA